jgi:hypothetical protein
MPPLGGFGLGIASAFLTTLPAINDGTRHSTLIQKPWGNEMFFIVSPWLV